MKVLIIDDNKDILFSIKLLLKKHAETIEVTTDPNTIPLLLSKCTYDVILLDMNFTSLNADGKEGFFWLNRILELDNIASVIFITAYGDVEKAVQGIKSGATDFILKPWHNEKLIATVYSAFRLRQSKSKANTLKYHQEELSAAIDKPFKEFIGKSESILKVYNTINKVAKTDANVLILGENGTGKELVARAIHRLSNRNKNLFLCVDLGTITNNLFESELFGHVKGSFTNATKDHLGRFEVSSGGTVFLDEIGNLPLHLQAKLLSVIEKRQVTKVGSNRSVSVDIRLICATNLHINSLENENIFRQDLLYRIKTVEIHIPPLRERVTDIPILMKHFLKIYSLKYNKNISTFKDSLYKDFKVYHWPGNVRELKQSIERAVILNESGILTKDDFSLFPSKSNTSNPSILSSNNISEMEKGTINSILKKHNGNISNSSKELGISRGALYRRIKKYDIQ